MTEVRVNVVDGKVCVRLQVQGLPLCLQRVFRAGRGGLSVRAQHHEWQLSD